MFKYQPLGCGLSGLITSPSWRFALSYKLHFVPVNIYPQTLLSTYSSRGNPTVKCTCYCWCKFNKFYFKIYRAESTVTDIPSIKTEPDSIKQEQDNIKREPDIIKQERNNARQEPNSIKEELIDIKQEQCTPVFDDLDSQLIQPSSCKQDVIKPEGSQRNINDRKKRLKLSY